MMMLRVCLLYLCLWAAIPDVLAQTIYPIRNGGLEAAHQDKFVMEGWSILRKGETPDIMPGPWEVYTPPAEGQSYVGLVAREDGTREGIYQALQEPLPAGRCLYLSVALAWHPQYSGYTLPLSLHIRGRKGLQGRIVSLAVSPLIAHTQWQYYTLEFTSPIEIDQLILEASWGPGVMQPYRGNILIDNISHIAPCLRAGLQEELLQGTAKGRG
jgi:hypothetical protein